MKKLKNKMLLLAGMLAFNSFAVDLSVNEGWNLLSTTEIIEAKDIKAELPCNIYTWRDNQYLSMNGVMTIHSGEGFWLYSESSEDITVPGIIGTPRVDVAGWNLKGSNEAILIPEAERSFYWNWKNNAYSTPIQIGLGDGYWFFNLTDGVTAVPGPPGPPGVPVRSEGIAITLDDLSWLESKEIKLLKSSLTKSDVGLGNIPNLDTSNASNLIAGTVHVARLPIIPVDKLPTIPASKISGLPDGVDISNISGDYITSGTVNINRLDIDAIAVALGITEMGFEPPKLTTAERLLIPTSEVEGKIIYDTDVESLMKGNSAGMWIKF